MIFPAIKKICIANLGCEVVQVHALERDIEGGGIFYHVCFQYTASKAAVHAITENLHNQVTAAGSPVKVSALFPGPHVVDTGLFNSGRVRPQELKKDVEGNESGISSVEDMKKMCAEFGIDLQTTHPDEVAAMAVAGLREDAFWLLATTEDTDAKIQARADMILNRETPVPMMVGT